MDYSKPAPIEKINAAIAALKKNGIEAEFVPTGADAKRRVTEIIPPGAEVMTMTSVTLDALGISEEINEGGKYIPTRAKLAAAKGSKVEQKKIGSAPEWAVGSVHAVTADGYIFVASNTGSQLPAYAYGAQKVLWVVGAQKVVDNREQAEERIYTYTLPLENERAKKAYGTQGSFVSKLLMFAREVEPGRLHMIILGEAVGF